MIQTKRFISAILLCSTLSLSAIDINNTVEIIEEASKATEKLQEDFSQLIETAEPIQEEIISTTSEHNITAQEVIIVDENVENISIEEHNETMQELTIMTDNKRKEPTKTITVEGNETVEMIPQTSIVNDTSINENNSTILIGTNSILEENQTIEQNSTIEEDGSFTEGMVIFKTKLKAVCKMTGEEFAKNYTQEDWDDIYDNDEFEKIVYEICPDMKDKYDTKWTKDLYQFSLKYASDSDEIPEC